MSNLKFFVTYILVKTWILYEDDRRRINATEMDELRRSARISKLDRKMNEYIKGKMDAQDILDDITRKQIIWYGHVERMDPTRIPKIIIHWKPEGKKKNEAVSEESEKMEYIQRRWRSCLRHCSTSRRSRVRFPIVSLDFFIDTILPAALWPWG